MNRNQLLLAIVFLAMTSGCGGGSTSVSPPVIVVKLSTMPPAFLPGSDTASVAATVTNDSANGGVKWSCTPASTCGSFNPTSTASGAMTTFTAPATAPSGGSVTIIATSVSDATKSANTSILMSGSASNATLNGQYAFLITAPTGNPVTRGTTTFVGSVKLDGAGHILGGVENIASTHYTDPADPILATSVNPLSTYSVDPSGHGTMTIQTQNGETLNFSFILTSASHAVIIETGGDPGSGTLDLQSGPFTLAQISGAYAFSLEGIDPAVPPTTKLSFGGVFIADGMGKITSGTLDVNSNGTVTSQPFVGNILSGPDSNGHGQLSMVPSGTTRRFTFYIVSPKVLRLIEDDGADLTGGSAFAQGAAATTLSGNFVFEHSGWSSTGRTVAAGQFAANGTSTIMSGVSDANAGGMPPTVPSTAKAVSGTFTMGQKGMLTLTDAAGNSMFNFYMVDPTLNILDPNNSTGGGGALLLHTDANINGTGILIPQVLPTPAGIVASQAINLRNSIASTTRNELDLVGVLTSDGSGKFNSGLADYDQDSATPAPVIGAPLTGTYAADSANAGHFTGTFSIPAPTGGYAFVPPSVAMFNVSVYQASGSQAIVIQTDSTANVAGYLIQQRLP
jgi:hypothetical protein